MRKLCVYFLACLVFGSDGLTGRPPSSCKPLQLSKIILLLAVGPTVFVSRPRPAPVSTLRLDHLQYEHGRISPPSLCAELCAWRPRKYCSRRELTPLFLAQPCPNCHLLLSLLLLLLQWLSVANAAFQYYKVVPKAGFVILPSVIWIAVGRWHGVLAKCAFCYHIIILYHFLFYFICSTVSIPSVSNTPVGISSTPAIQDIPDRSGVVTD